MKLPSSPPIVLLSVLVLWLGSCTPPPPEKTAPKIATPSPETTKTVPAPEVAPVAPVAKLPPAPPTSPPKEATAGTLAPVPPAPVKVTPVPEKATPLPAQSPAPTQTQTPTPEAAPAPVPPPTPTPVAPPKPVAPLTAPTLEWDPPPPIAPGALTIRPMVSDKALIRYTLDGSDPATGKPCPEAGLVVDKSAKLRVWAAQPEGPATVKEVNLTVGEVWVKAGATGSGTWDAPLGSLADALVKAKTLGVTKIRLGPGSQPVQVELSGTWELWGGSRAPGEAEGGPTVFTGVKQSGSTQKSPAYVLKIADGASVSLSGLEVKAPSSSFATAVSVGQGATVQVADCRLTGGAGLYGYGLRAVGAKAVTIADSVLSGGEGGSSFALSGENSVIKAVRTRFDAGTGNAVSYGINLTLTKIEVVSCVVWGGSGNSSYGVGLYTSTGSRFVGSTILGGNGTSAWAFYVADSDPEIVNCLIGSAGRSKSYGLFANFGKSLPRALRSNAFFSSASGAFSGASLGKLSGSLSDQGAFLDADGAPFPNQSLNRIAQPALGPGPEFRTLESSPKAILEGAEALGGEADLNIAKKSRATRALGAW